MKNTQRVHLKHKCTENSVQASGINEV